MSTLEQELTKISKMMEIIIRLTETESEEPTIDIIDRFGDKLIITIGNKGDIRLASIRNILHERFPKIFPDKKTDFHGQMPSKHEGEYLTLGLLMSNDMVFPTEDKKWELVMDRPMK